VTKADTNTPNHQKADTNTPNHHFFTAAFVLLVSYASKVPVFYAERSQFTDIIRHPIFFPLLLRAAALANAAADNCQV